MFVWTYAEAFVWVQKLWNQSGHPSFASLQWLCMNPVAYMWIMGITPEHQMNSIIDLWLFQHNYSEWFFLFFSIKVLVYLDAIGHHVPISCDCAILQQSRVPTEAQECIVPFCSWHKITKQFTQPCAPPLSSSRLGISGGSSLGNYDFSVFQGQSSIVGFFSVFQF